MCSSARPPPLKINKEKGRFDKATRLKEAKAVIKPLAVIAKWRKKALRLKEGKGNKIQTLQKEEIFSFPSQLTVNKLTFYEGSCKPNAKPKSLLSFAEVPPKLHG